MRLKIFACVFSCIMFTGLLFAQETITVQPDDKVVTNEMPVSSKGEPLEKDLLKSIDLAANTLFSIKLNATNFDRYIRITSYSTNLDFVRFTRDKTNAFLTFTTLTPGIAKLNFQVDTEENIIKRYIYTINVTNGDAITDTNSTMFDAETTNEAPTTNDMIMDTNETVTNTTDTNTTNNTAATNATATNAANNTTQQQQTVTKTTQAEDNSEVALLFKSAEELKNMKDYDNAIISYNNVISQYPDSKYAVYSYFRVGDIYNLKKDYTNAFDTYKKASELKTANNNQKAAALYSMGVVRKVENNNQEAMKYFNDVIAKYPNTYSYGNAVYEIADSLKQMGKISDGLNMLEKSLASKEKFSKRADAMLLLAEIYETGNNNVRDFNKAYLTYNQYLSEYPNTSKTKYANDRKNFLSRNAVNIK
ncbi:putative TPR-repeat-containing protein [Brachyspira pilosicoli B2904]|uniref:Putative TPR-repeat-containing protein n=1 Tax=Brachyspira pilosicoli B2904 TaxID=1133568 RepID=J9UHB4_BRAPL|nr:tetratricopeptide repeat protein [Brachyspira pilosicoli]AFR70836.1 putative TPR-repeat-containing protein [Brachyspira pilosicoli B2904]